MQNLSKLGILILWVVVSSSVAANTLQVNLGAEAIEARFDAVHSSNNVNWSLAGLITEDNGEVISLGAYAIGEFSNAENLRGGLGARVYHINGDNDSFQALSLGGTLIFGVQSVKGLNVSLDLYYAPSVSITKDYESLFDANFRINYQAFENVQVYAGIRNLDVELVRSFTIDDSPYIGIQLYF